MTMKKADVKKTNISLQARKQLFNEYADCRYFKISSKGKVLKDIKIDVEYVDVDKKGNVYVEWQFDDYDKLHSAEVNVVRQAAYDDNIDGVFTSKEEALAVAKEWFKEEKKDKIAELEEELAELKKSM